MDWFAVVLVTKPDKQTFQRQKSSGVSAINMDPDKSVTIGIIVLGERAKPH
jgi:hypothetical protein